MRRRAFIAAISGAAAWPVVARAQPQPLNRMRRVGVLIPFSDTDAETQVLVAAFKQRFQDLGWTDGRNVRFDYRYTDGNPERTRSAGAELVGLAPDVILAYANPAVSFLIQVTRTIPIVFAQASDPVGSGFVSNLAHPGGNITGFHSFEPAIGGKWLEILKQVAPSVRRAAVVHHPNIAANTAFVRAAEAASTTFGVTVTAAGVLSAADIERALTARVWHRWKRHVARGRVLHRPHPARGKARGTPGAIADQVRAGHQPQHCKSPRH
jgi:putative ABC transport system substrate-binding protein